MTGSPPSTPAPLTQRSARVVAARRLHRRRERDHSGLLLVEGPQAVREALAEGLVTELFVEVGRAEQAVPAAAGQVRVHAVTAQGLAALAQTVTPQGVVAVARHRHTTLGQALAHAPRLAVVLAGIADPGNAGAVLRTADAAGAGVVVFPDGSVDPYNGKCVRASAGSLFHLDVVRGGSEEQAVAELKRAGFTVLAADAHGGHDLDDLLETGGLGGRTGWIFGAEAHGLPPQVCDLADATVRVPIHGRAESLNLAAAAAVCLYASARAQRRADQRGKHRGDVP
ncbi:MAG TPA: RNA methyltransferase [Micromonosporaceae bacterium]|jgi:TrmH family RNA methyltransferase